MFHVKQDVLQRPQATSDWPRPIHSSGCSMQSPNGRSRTSGDFGGDQRIYLFESSSRRSCRPALLPYAGRSRGKHHSAP